MFSGVSGLRVHQTKMDVIANNIANVNTVGYKSSRVTFRDAFYQRLQGAAGPNPETGRAGTNPMQVGLGASLGSIDTVMTQGLSQRTDRSLDVMIQSEGFFIVRDASGLFFTRAGNIDIDREMNLHINGMTLMGWDRRFVEGEYIIETGPVKPINLGGDKQYMEPKPTEFIDLIGNLTPTGLINNQTTRSISFTDTLGNVFAADVVFTYHNEQGDPVYGYWTYEYRTDADGLVLATDINGNIKRLLMHVESAPLPDGSANPKNPTDINIVNVDTVEITPLPADARMNPKGVLIFNTNGILMGAGALTQDILVTTLGDVSTSGMLDPSKGLLTFDTAAVSGGNTAILRANPVASVNLLIAPYDALDPPATFGDSQKRNTAPIINYPMGYLPDPAGNIKPIGRLKMNVGDLNQWRGENISIKYIDKDGNPPGELRDINVGPDGKLTGRYSNGRTRLLGQIPVAKFQNPAGLEKMGNNLFAVTTNSGPFDGVGQTGEMQAGTLEMSNVDLANEFTEMITTQRGFQANSRVISTSDDMLQELVNLRR
jgi:flagellar hook protein FlgE